MHTEGDLVQEEEEAATAEAEDEEDGSVETSLEELLQRKERRGMSDEEDDEEALIDAIDEREGRAESLTVKVIPPQPTEFTCRGCFLLKHQTQLKDKRRMLCRDCA
jgi:hypothetical protein